MKLLFRHILAKTLLLLAFFTFGLQSFVPTGYMLASSADSNFVTVQICAASGTRDAYFNVKTGEINEDAPTPAHDEDQQDNINHVCAQTAHDIMDFQPSLGQTPANYKNLQAFQTSSRGPPSIDRASPPLPARAPPVSI